MFSYYVMSILYLLLLFFIYEFLFFQFLSNGNSDITNNNSYYKIRNINKLKIRSKHNKIHIKMKFVFY